MNLGDLTNFVEKPLAVVSNIIVNTPELGRDYRPFYLRNLRCRAALMSCKGARLSSSLVGHQASVRRPRRKIAEAGGTVVLVHAPWKASRTS